VVAPRQGERVRLAGEKSARQPELILRPALQQEEEQDALVGEVGGELVPLQHGQAVGVIAHADHLSRDGELRQRLLQGCLGRRPAAHADLVAGEAFEVRRPALAVEHAGAVDEGRDGKVDQLAPRQGGGGRPTEQVDGAVLERREAVLGTDADKLDQQVRSVQLLFQVAHDHAAKLDRETHRVTEFVAIGEGRRVFAKADLERFALCQAGQDVGLGLAGDQNEDGGPGRDQVTHTQSPPRVSGGVVFATR
jgi:hypothetical protein